MDAKTIETVEDKKQSKIEDYLTGPKKKRKNYVVLALGKQFDPDLNQAINSFIGTNYSQLSVANPHNSHELSRQFSKQISLLVIDDAFDKSEVVMALVKALKQRRRADTIPVLFLTKNAPRLISLYHDHLLEYHETDEYIHYPGVNRNLVFARIRAGIEEQNRKRSRRYNINIPVTFLHLAQDRLVEGKLIDLSLHGAILEAGTDTIFKAGDQVKIHVPVMEFIDKKRGDFIRVSGRVRRVYISGSTISLSFAHMTNEQYFYLGRFLTTLVTKQMQRRAAHLRQSLESSENQKG